MTPEMLDLARRNADRFRQRIGLDNVEFRQGQIEALPLDDASVDVVISNCVINLSPDKPRVFREVFRILKPGGRMIVSDIVLNRPLPEAARRDQTLYTGCVAGAALRREYLEAIRSAGFGQVGILSDRPYVLGQLNDDAATAGLAAALDGTVASLTILALKSGACGCGCAGR